VIATKGGLRMTDEGLVRDSSPAWLRSGVHDSLRALEVDQIDVYQVHWPDPHIPLADTAGALQELVEEGKIGHVGVSNFDAPQIDDFSRTRPVETVGPFHAFASIGPWERKLFASDALFSSRPLLRNAILTLFPGFAGSSRPTASVGLALSSEQPEDHTRQPATSPKAIER
jgi:hypothetical protein